MTDNIENSIAIIRIKAWEDDHPRRGDLQAVIDAEKQTNWVAFAAEWHHSDHILVALQGETIVGFLRYVIQAIGPDMDCSPLQYSGYTLTEAKILAFGVPPAYRRQGIGRALQIEAIQRAKAHGCYQIRSRSDGNSLANHQLKLSLGFAVHPIGNAEDERDVYFVMPLAGKQV